MATPPCILSARAVATITAAGGLQPRLAALDVEEFLRAEIGAEPGFGDDVIGELQRGARRDEGIAAVRDIGERAAVHQRRIALQGLHEIGAQREPEQRRHRARRLEIARRHRLLGPGIGDHHAAEPRLEIVEVVGETKRRHHLGGDGDVEAVRAREAVGDAAEPDDDFAQRAIVDVERAPPDDAAGVDVERIAPVDVVVDHRGEQIVRGGDRVEIAGEMQVDLVHRRDLRISAARRAALHAEARPERGLAQADRDALADARERVAETDRGRRLAFARRRRADRGDEDELAVRLAGEPGEEAVVDLGDRAAVRMQRLRRDAELGADRRDGRERGLARDFTVRLHCRRPLTLRPVTPTMRAVRPKSAAGDRAARAVCRAIGGSSSGAARR